QPFEVLLRLKICGSWRTSWSIALSTSLRKDGSWRGQFSPLPLPGPTPQPWPEGGGGVACGSCGFAVGAGAGAWGVGTGTGTTTTGSVVRGPVSGSVGRGISSLIVVQEARNSAMTATRTSAGRIRNPRRTARSWLKILVLTADECNAKRKNRRAPPDERRNLLDSLLLLPPCLCVAVRRLENRASIPRHVRVARACRCGVPRYGALLCRLRAMLAS